VKEENWQQEKGKKEQTNSRIKNNERMSE